MLKQTQCFPCGHQLNPELCHIGKMRKILNYVFIAGALVLNDSLLFIYGCNPIVSLWYLVCDLFVPVGKLHYLVMLLEYICGI
jgi:hypothetical protein